MNSRRMAGSALLGGAAVYLNHRLASRPISASVWTALQHRNTELEATVAEQKAQLLEQQTRLGWQETQLAEQAAIQEAQVAELAEPRVHLAELPATIAALERDLRTMMIDNGATIVFQKRSHDSIDLIAVNLAARKQLGFLGRFDYTVGAWALGWLGLSRVGEHRFLDLEPDEQAWLVERICPADLRNDLSWHAANVRLFN